MGRRGGWADATTQNARPNVSAQMMGHTMPRIHTRERAGPLGMEVRAGSWAADALPSVGGRVLAGRRHAQRGGVRGQTPAGVVRTLSRPTVGHLVDRARGGGRGHCYRRCRRC